MPPCSRLALAILAVIAMAGLACAQSDVKKPPAARPYAAGPLAAADFAGQPPESTPVNLGIEMVATTECQVRYTYRSSIEPNGEAFSARIVSFESEAVILPNKCWNTRPDSHRVLDHEQGHFDLAEIAAHRAQQHFAGLMKDDKATLRAADKRSLRRALDAQVKKIMKEVYDSLEKAQKTYDAETRHGTALVPQLRHRQWQRTELERLARATSQKSSDQ